MKKTLVLLSVMAAGLSVTACSYQSSALDKPPGKYEHTSSSTNANGTTVERKSTADVRYDANGNKIAVVKNKQTRDPPGLFNKSTSESDEVIEEKN